MGRVLHVFFNPVSLIIKEPQFGILEPAIPTLEFVLVFIIMTLGPIVALNEL